MNSSTKINNNSLSGEKPLQFSQNYYKVATINKKLLKKSSVELRETSVFLCVSS